LQSVAFAIVPSGNDLTLRSPDKRGEWQELRGHADDSLRRQLRTSRIGNGDGRVVGDKGKRIAGRRKRNVVDPAGRGVQKLAAHGVEGQALAPHARRRPLVDAFDEAAKDARVAVRRARRQQHAVRVPAHARDRRPDRLLQLLRHPPVVLLFEMADGDQPSTRAGGELRFGR